MYKIISIIIVIIVGAIILTLLKDTDLGGFGLFGLFGVAILAYQNTFKKDKKESENDNKNIGDITLKK